ncbi:dTDP-glucose pyrophosphorylase [Paenibacillus harenae]|uniref:dTDP-glucose pyrophosphorylase n=1 Tax=Paenibacillus harenae TaxID=306543 RepID=A0ABT9U6H5_PAEHA|nr:dTDP-glucose pyrophosphorylase [Paenibacillus harenae]
MGMAEGFVNNDRMVVVLGNNVFEDQIVEYVYRFLIKQAAQRLYFSRCMIRSVTA